MIRRMPERGDTIIEVMLAVTVFAMLAVGVVVTMNRGAAIAEQSLEITLVRQQIDSQADLLRYVHSRYMAGDNEYTVLWASLRADANNTPSGSVSQLGVASCPTPAAAQQRGFALYTTASGVIKRTAGGVWYAPADTYAQINYSNPTAPYMARGLHIKMLRAGTVATGGSSTHAKAFDAYINACWDRIGGGPPQTMGTIVRLYDPI